MKNFLVKLIFFSVIGLIILFTLLLSYIIMDPFKVLRNYKDYSYSYVISNRDYISTQVFLNNYKKYNYNSFIFGSSRTLAFKSNSWSKYLPEGAHPYLFDASGESVYGIYKKIEFLDSMNVKINNALLIICRDVSFANSKNDEGHLFIKDPRISGESKLEFQYIFFKSYLDRHFFYNYYNYLFTKQYTPSMAGYIENRKIQYDTIANDIFILDQEKEINLYPTQYYNKRKNIFYKRKTEEQVDSIVHINKTYLVMLNKIKSKFDKDHTNYKIVISPLYEQIRFNRKDLEILKKIFGENKVYDFSGKNLFTIPITNYYESSHYRPQVGDSIFNIIYH